MLNCLAVFIGGGLGSVLRYLTGKFLNFGFFPLSTFLVNITGCFILGLILGLSIKNANLNTTFKTALTVGFCGGLTTFSTFSAEGFNMLKQGQINMFFLYTLLSLILGIIGVYLGTITAKNIF